MANFPNPYDLPDQEYYMRRYINDLPKSFQRIVEDDLNLNESGDDLAWMDAIELNLASSVFTSCANLQTLVAYTDDFARSNNLDFGIGWEQFYQSTVYGKIFNNNLKVYKDPSPLSNTVKGAWLKAFPATQTHQLARMIYGGSSLIDTVTGNPVQLDLTAGGPCVKMNNQGGGTTFEANIRCYNLWYQETRTRSSGYAVSQAIIYLDYLSILGYSNLKTTFVTPMSVGDELMLTSMNFIHSTLGPATCLKCFINGIQKGTTVTLYENFNPTYIGTGRAGWGLSALGSDSFYGFDWLSWEGDTCTPV